MKPKDQKKNDDLASQVLEHLKNPPIEVIDPKADQSNIGKRIFTFLVVIIIAAAGFAVWKFILADKPAENQASQPASTETSTTTKSNADPLSQQYTSDKLMMDINYPVNWKVDESSGEILLYSPEEDVEDANGDKIPAEFRVIIKQGAGEPDSEYLGRGAAVEASETIKYANPATGQREKTLLTNFGLDSSAYFSYFVVQGNFKLKKNETLGKDFASEADDILISGGFYSKDSKDKTQLVPISLDSYKDNHTYQTAVEIVKTLQLR